METTVKCITDFSWFVPDISSSLCNDLNIMSSLQPHQECISRFQRCGVVAEGAHPTEFPEKLMQIRSALTQHPEGLAEPHWAAIDMTVPDRL